ncbi:MAG TPA: metal-dependent hydrolase, partial [Croceibacterium sp.]|nr:metal-dependent hydrolase [Croceibacterium sp.]
MTVPTPNDLEITVRDRRFGRGAAAKRWWLDGDPVASCWFTALSLTFPRGEAFFIEAVRANREGAPPRLEAEIRAFVRQEANHSREHIVFNRAAEAAGYDVSAIDRHVASLIEEANGRPPIARLAVTMALEHFTAMFAHDFLANSEQFVRSEVEQAELWRWHAAEEIEHKGVAYDTWLHATRDWPRFRRWGVRSLVMLNVTKRFVSHRTRDALDLLAQDGLGRGEARRRLLWYLFGTPGVLRRIFPAWLGFFRPGFHPW